MSAELTTKHGRPVQGSTQGRLACAPYGGQTYFDTDLQTLMYRDSETNEWRPMGMPAIEPGSDGIPAGLTALKGALLYNVEDDAVDFSDGVVWQGVNS